MFKSKHLPRVFKVLIVPRISSNLVAWFQKEQEPYKPRPLAARWFILTFLVLETAHPTLDLDLGWHLRYGEYFFRTGTILRENILSIVWPGYHWVQASWGFDLLIYQIFTNFGFPGLTVVTTLISLAVFLILAYPLKNKSPLVIFFLVIIFLSQCSIMFGSGLRTQLLSGLFFSLTLVIIREMFERNNLKLGSFLPLIFLLWANFHGGFILGLVVVLIFWGTHGLILLYHLLYRKFTQGNFEYLQTKTWLLFGLIILVSSLTPLINPWGYKLYLEGFRHTTNPNLAQIREWEPLFSAPVEMTIASLFGLFTILVAIRRKRLQDLPYIITLLVMMSLAFSAVRFMSNFGMIMVFYLAQSLGNFQIKKLTQPWIKSLLLLGFLTLITYDMFGPQVYFVPPIHSFWERNWDEYCQAFNECSEKVTQIMLQDPPKGPGFNGYNYGGYLIWRVPAVKDFLDGRMSAWEDNGKTPPIALADGIYSKQGLYFYRKLDSEYHFQWAILSTDTPVAKYLDNFSKKGLWEKRYQDKNFSYFIKKF